MLGHAHAEAFLTNGAVVIATDLPGKKSDSLKDRYASHNNFAYYDLDVSDEAQVKQIFKTLLADGYKPNVVLNNAAITGELLMGPAILFPEFRDTSLEDWEKTMRVNLTAPFLLARQMCGYRHSWSVSCTINKCIIYLWFMGYTIRYIKICQLNHFLHILPLKLVSMD